MAERHTGIYSLLPFPMGGRRESKGKKKKKKKTK